MNYWVGARSEFDQEKMKKKFMAYGGAQNKDETISMMR